MKTKHHIIPTSRGGLNVHENIIRLHMEYHNALHRCHGNAMPHEQLADLMRLNAQVLRQEFADKVAKLLESEP